MDLEAIDPGEMVCIITDFGEFTGEYQSQDDDMIYITLTVTGHRIAYDIKKSVVIEVQRRHILGMVQNT